MKYVGLVMRVVLLSAMVLCASCGESTSNVVYEEGGDCESLGAITCGRAGDNDVVLVCSKATDEVLTWSVHKTCAYGCEGAACTLPDVEAEDWRGSREVAPEPDLELNFGDVPTWDSTPFEEMGCGGYLASCTLDEECCDPGLCIQGPDGYVCTKTCFEDCAEGWECEDVWQGAEVTMICVPTSLNNLCTPCYKDTDCNIINDLCLPIGAGGALMCSRDCKEAMCPPDFECAEVEDSKGAPGMQCLPISGACECVGMTKDDYNTDPDNCGDCGIVCAYDNAEPVCEEGDCIMGPCAEGWDDLNKLDSDGCEYECVDSGEPDKPDLDGFDTNCDGIDGDLATAVFVAPTGMDIGNQTGDMEHPVKTIAKGMALAAAKEPPADVYVAQGIYEEQILLVEGVSLYGGFNPELNWDHDPSLHKTTIHWSNPGPGGVIAVLAHSISKDTVVQGFNIEAGNNDEAGGSSMAIHIMKSNEKLVFSYNRIQGGNGGNGTAGNDGADGQPGEDGANGNNGCEYGGNWCAVSCSGCDHPPAGKGGNGHCANSGGTGGKGGGSGDGGNAGAAAEDGASGGPGGGKKSNGGPGTDGGSGAPGNQGTGGDGLGTVNDAGFWIPSSGTGGTAGTSGKGGGGGGGGGGDDNSLCYCYTYGASGAGGGGGGCPGTPGTAGGGAGGSFGIVVVNSTATIANNEIIYRFGGNGGIGGKGGIGGAEGYGGNGGPGGQDDNEGGGGKGGNGGKGGSAGGGGGGSGGAAYGILWAGEQSPKCEKNDFENQGGPGLGGLGGSPSDTSNGKEGESAAVYNPTVDCSSNN